MSKHLLTTLAATLIGAAGPSAMAQTSSPTTPAPATAAADPYLWLEDVTGERALTWVRERNAVSRPLLEAHPDFQANRKRFKEILDSKESIPVATHQGGWLYNFWRDEQHPRGLWRRATLAEYRKPQPAWDVVLDLDALAKAENESWVWAGANCLGGGSTRCLISLSRGGADASVVREFDLATRRFVEGGFALPEAKSSLEWLDENTTFVGTDFGPGSLTDSGYPRVIKRWKRGEPLSAAVTVYEGQATDVSAFASVDHTPGFERVVFGRSPDFFSTEMALWQGDKAVTIDKPADAQLGFWRDLVMIELRSDWTVGGRTWPRGSLLVADAAGYLRGERKFTALFTPTASRSMAGYSTTRSQVLVNVLDNVSGRAEAWHRDTKGSWVKKDIVAPYPGTLRVNGLHDPQVKNDPLAENFFASYTDFLTPDTLSLGSTGNDTLEKLKARPTFFDAAGMKAEQRFATSKDGTKVPYFIVWPKGAKADGSNPTLLYGYGGFEVSMNPSYSGAIGNGWYNKGGVFVLANIRGGGEFGPGWHQAAIKQNKQKSYDDFIAVAEDLIATKVTDPRHLGIEGGSNGGLLVGAVMVQRPDLFNAVVCQVPLLDMRRFNQLLAGASWMGEYGNPDMPDEWAWISKYSPYQNLKANAKYPKPLIITSTRDDRVHPGHARKMAARMMEQGHAVLYHEYIEGGHSAAADNAQRADRQALEFAYLWQQLGR
ncbi:MAG TPA: prolyl oligopeptidase family serine peptidase [Ideonella sp.]|nr:prolyl oligopeptidase family serine peptidase [Ideonella sp.]HEX5686269.1 prolyl oligopeptidase family serine peptidase [Ideonella sp.]